MTLHSDIWIDFEAVFLLLGVMSLDVFVVPAFVSHRPKGRCLICYVPVF
jgi:hypothetical protein